MKKRIALTLAVVCIVMAAVPAINAAPRAVTISEVESNNSFSLAQTIQNDYTVSGTISSETDVDFYKVVFPYTGYANFWLGNIPTDMDYDLYLYRADQTILRSSTTTSEQELISNYQVNAGETYYIKVLGYQGDYSATSYSLRAKLYLNGYAYYSQDQLNFDTTNMEKLYNTGCPSISWKNRLIDEGCAICCYAMVLNNMDKTIYAPDVRSADENGSIPYATLVADPYSVMWANSYGPTSISYDATADKFTAVSGMDPVNTDLGAIATRFNVDYDWYEIGNYGDTYKKQAIAYLLSQYPQGVCLYFSNGSYTHMIVVTETTYSTENNVVLPAPYLSSSYRTTSQTPIETFTTITAADRVRYNTWIESKAITALSDGDKFTVYDPYCGSYGGNGVLLSQSYAGSVYSWSNLKSIRILH